MFQTSVNQIIVTWLCKTRIAASKIALMLLYSVINFVQLKIINIFVMVEIHIILLKHWRFLLMSNVLFFELLQCKYSLVWLTG